MYIETSKGKFPVRYGLNALAQFGDLTNKSMDDVMSLDLKKMSISDILTFIFVGFSEGARKLGEECQIKTIQEVGDMIDEDPKLIDKVMGAFAEMNKSEGDGDKKK